MGGNITLYSSLGNGSTFNLFLPLIVANAQDDIAEIEELFVPGEALAKQGNAEGLTDNEWGLEGKTILLVDDDERNLFSLSEVLSTYGMCCITADGGHQALELLKDHKEIDLVLMDMMMPGMDGDEAISRIRFTARGEFLPIISLTANAMPQHRQICLAAGANDFLTKPVDIETLLAKMGGLL
jgi:two-component system, chemotaxis family, sensor kinase CheA